MSPTKNQFCFKWLTLAVLSLSFLTACDKTQSSVSKEAIATALQEQAQEKGQQVLSDAQKHITLHTPSLMVQQTPDAYDATHKIIIHAIDDANDVILDAAEIGQARETENYFQKLKDSLESHQDFQDLTIGFATENRMNYHFAYQEHGRRIQEGCVALLTQDATIYAICAISSSQSFDTLNSYLQDIQIAHKSVLFHAD